MSRWNSRNAAVKRIVQELKECQQDDNPDVFAEAVEDDIFEWYFAIRGAWGTEFEGGIYHGRILLPADFPFKPPSFVMLTTSGRFETGTPICLSISSHHPESWQPSWTVRSALVALIAFMQTPGSGALGSLEYPPGTRRELARQSRAAAPSHAEPGRRSMLERLHAAVLEAESRSRLAAGVDSEKGPGKEAEGRREGADAEERSAPYCESAKRAEAGAEAQAAAPSDAPGASSRPASALAEAGGKAESARSAAPLASPADARAAAAEEAAGSDSAPRRAPLHAAARTPSGDSATSGRASRAQHLQRARHERAVPTGGWEDKGLTYLAVVLVLAIVALLARKMLVASDVHGDELYAFRRIADVDL